MNGAGQVTSITAAGGMGWLAGMKISGGTAGMLSDAAGQPELIVRSVDSVGSAVFAAALLSTVAGRMDMVQGMYLSMQERCAGFF